MVEFSLITTSRGRSADLERLLESLCAQTPRSLELILIDQTSGAVLDSLIDRFKTALLIKRIRVAPCGISAARNEGLKHVHGQIVGFPDDDCVYPGGLLQHVFYCLESRSALDGLSCFVCDAGGHSSAGGMMHKKACRITAYNVWKTTVSCSFFVRREVIAAVGPFDEQLGVGSASGCHSGEETDFLLRALRLRKEMIFCPQWQVIHRQPVFSLGKAYGYGRGAGRVLRKHQYPLWFIGASAGFQMVRACGELVRLRAGRAAARVAMAVGRLRRV